MSDNDMSPEKPAFTVIRGGLGPEHYDWADLQNPYSFGNIYVSAAKNLGFKFKIGTPSKENLLGIRTDQTTIDKMDEIGDLLRRAGITGLYMAVDEGNLEVVGQNLKRIENFRQPKHIRKPVFNLDFMRKAFMRTYDRNQQKDLEPLVEADKPIPPTDEDRKLYERIKFSMQGQIFNHTDMISELAGVISHIVRKYPHLRPEIKK